MLNRSSGSVSVLEDHLGYWMRLVSNHVSGSFAQALHASNFSVAEWVVMRHLYDRPEITATEIALILGMTRGAISKVLDKLQDKGLIERSTRQEDQRAQQLSLTSEGRRVLPELAEIADRNDRQFFGSLTAAEKAVLRGLLQKLAQEHRWNDVPVD